MDAGAYVSSSENVAKLQRLYRISEGDRKAYCRDTKVTLLRQRKIIHKLEAEKEKILSQLNVYDEDRVGSETDLSVLFDLYKQKRRQLHQERQAIQNQTSEIRNLEREIEKLIAGKAVHRKCSSAPHRHTEPANMTARRIEILEDRLENASVQYNRLVYNGSRLRGNIESLLKMRNVRRGIFGRVGHIVSNLKAQMERLTGDAIQNYNAREAAYERLQALKVDHLLEDRLCRSQVQEAQRSLESQRSLMAFVATKNKSRTKAAFDRAPDGKRSSTAQRSNRPQQDKDIMAAEYENTELFRYTSSLNNKVEELRSDIDGLLDESRLLEDGLNLVDGSQEMAAKELEGQIADLSGKCDSAEAQLKLQEKTLEKLKSDIGATLRVVGCRAAFVSNSVDGHENEDVSKMVIAKAIKDIETSVDELLRTKHYLEIKEAGEHECGKMVTTVAAISRRRPTRASVGSIRMMEFAVPAPTIGTLEDADTQVAVDNHMSVLTEFIGNNVTDAEASEKN